MKGIIMAGGAGSRLRPLTCDLPKPMVPVMTIPVMTYSIELLKKYGINTIGVTLQYLPKVIQDYYKEGGEYGVDLHYFVEDKPLGTAGSVKNAEEILDETFVVISGDALTNIDIQKAVDFHKKNNSVATLVLKRVEVPLEYGVVMTDEQGAITRFLEKPNWGEVFSDTVNTGIYILEPEVLEYFEPGRKFDFSQDLFPMLLKDGKPMYGYVTDEYWCDIGDLNSYLQAHFDMMDGKVGFSLPGKLLKDNVWIGEHTEINQDADIKGPCYIGNYTRIGKGVTIHPYTVIGDYNNIDQGTSIKRSVLWNYNIIGKDTEIRGAVLCNKTEVKNNVCMYEGSVIGEGSQLNEYSVVKPDVKIWPGKSIGQGVVVRENLVWGTRFKKNLFGKDGIKGQLNMDINPQFASRLGCAFGSELKPGKRIGVSCDDNKSSNMLKYALISGALSSGLEVFDMGQLTTPILRYAIRYFGLDGGVHLFAQEDDNKEVHIHLLNEKGANLPPSMERKIENVFVRDDSLKQPPEKIMDVKQIHDVPIFYVRSLINSINTEEITKKNFKILFSSKGRLITSVFMSIASELGFSVEKIQDNFEDRLKDGSYDLACIIDSNGEDVQLYDERGNQVKKDMFTALISLMCLKTRAANEVVVPLNAPEAIEKLAQSYNGTVVRTKTNRQAIMDEVLKREKNINDKGQELFTLYFDGTATFVKLLEFIADEDKKLSNIIEGIPTFHMVERTIQCPWTAKGRVMRSLIEEEAKGKNQVELFEGVKINHKNGWTLILPDSDEPVCRIYSEGLSEEYAEELTDFYEKKINQIKLQ